MSLRWDQTKYPEFDISHHMDNDGKPYCSVIFLPDMFTAFVGFAFLHERDNYDRETAKSIAFGRLLRGIKDERQRRHVAVTIKSMKKLGNLDEPAFVAALTGKPIQSKQERKAIEIAEQKRLRHYQQRMAAETMTKPMQMGEYNEMKALKARLQQ